MARSIDALSDEERISYYRHLSREAFAHARDARDDRYRAAYLEIANRWTQVADDLEQVLANQRERAERIARHSRQKDGDGYS